VVAVAGKHEQALRFDPFSMGAHYHIRPGLADQIPLPLAEGQSPLDAAMAFFERPLRFRGLLALAEEDDAASQLRDEELKDAASQIRALLLRMRAWRTDRHRSSPRLRNLVREGYGSRDRPRARNSAYRGGSARRKS
jgi:hypothetical protein